jgi:hypothetical protein
MTVKTDGVEPNIFPDVEDLDARDAGRNVEVFRDIQVDGKPTPVAVNLSYRQASDLATLSWDRSERASSCSPTKRDCPHCSGRSPNAESPPSASIFGSADDEHRNCAGTMSRRSPVSSPNPMRRLPAARVIVIFDVDHHFDVRQMRRKRSTVYAALGGTLGSLNPDWPLQSQRHRAPRPARRL